MSEDVKALMIWIPAKLHRAFKKKLAGSGQTIKGVVISFLEAYLGKNPEKSPDNSGSTSKS
ncbi:MAG: hypothetical protein MUP81_01865 [Dehalococcoidia bacterium]|nr:hypothetical protein [Dehalococcoidia bacterium]